MRLDNFSVLEENGMMLPLHVYCSCVPDNNKGSQMQVK